MQQFKSVYFADYPATSTKARNLKLAFGSGDGELFELVNCFSSEQLRSILGEKFAMLRVGAEEAGLSINSFCLSRLRQAAESPQLQLTDIPCELRVDPLQATFRGGVNEPLHNWYPYLEGYSPDFVGAMLDTFAPTARHVLDPFGGSGTTPLTVARRGIRGSYCELNPLLQFLIEAKVGAAALPEHERLSLAKGLILLADNLRAELKEHAPDRRLAEAYPATFGVSEFFPPETFQVVLQLRSWLDSLDCTAPLAAELATVAVISSLIPTSHLIRRGDLRFRKGPMETGQVVVDAIGEVSRRLRAIASDLVGLRGIGTRPLLISGDAKRLNRVAPLDVDAVITSPPYLNGTNYYRNTKVELWFLRALLSGRDLASFRRQTVTAGINDVTIKKDALPVSSAIEAVAKQLASESYDRRIPQMVLNYFDDMSSVLDSLALHMKPGAPLLIDIGDSAYAGVHVDTPTILAELMALKGWKVGKEVTLRQRLSRNGQLLRQVLLVAHTGPYVRTTSSKAPVWNRRWSKFKRSLPHQQGDYAKRNWGHPLHSLCSYQGKMKASLAKHLVDTFVPSGGRMLDPFGGVGTIPFEAASIGAQTWSFDISPAAVPIAAAKLQPATVADCVAVLQRLQAFIRANKVRRSDVEETARVRFNGPISDYFHPKTFAEILLARRYFSEKTVNDSATSLVFASLLHVLHGNRPYALSRNSHPITPFAPTGEAEYKSLIQKVENKMMRALEVPRPSGFVAGLSLFQDATKLWSPDVDDLDAIITSPPFFDSTRFYLANWMRLWFAGWTAWDFKQRPMAFIDERQKYDFSVYLPILRQAKERLKFGGVCVMHLGKSRKCDMATEIAKLAKHWFAKAEVFGENVEHCESHGIRDKGTVVEHTYLVLH